MGKVWSWKDAGWVWGGNAWLLPGREAADLVQEQDSKRLRLEHGWAYASSGFGSMTGSNGSQAGQVRKRHGVQLCEECCTWKRQ